MEVDECERLNSVLKDLVDAPVNNGSAPAPAPAPVLNGPALLGRHVKDILGIPGIMSLMFPELYSGGKGEYNTEPERTKEDQPRTFRAYVRGILESDQGHHFAKNETWAAMCFHLIMTPAILRVGGAFVDEHWASLTRLQLREQLSSKDPEIRTKVLRGLIPWMQGIVGSAGYHKSHRSKIANYLSHYSYFWGGSSMSFNTISTADVQSHFIQAGLALLSGEIDGDEPVLSGQLGGYPERHRRLIDDPRGAEGLSSMRLDSLTGMVAVATATHMDDLKWFARWEYQNRVRNHPSCTDCNSIARTYSHMYSQLTTTRAHIAGISTRTFYLCYTEPQVSAHS